MKKYFLALALVFMGGCAFVFSPSTAQAYANTPQIDSAYNSRIIDDSIFLNTQTMGVQDIQNFLNNKVPVCDSNHAGGLTQYPPPYVCLKDYVDPTTGKRAAQLIYDEATSIGLNPQVILTTLQKEQSLVTDTWPYPSQYKSAMGYGCPESQSVCDSQYYGFYNQIHLGARLLRAGVARDCGDTSTLSAWTINSQWRRGNTVTIDGRATYLSTCATGSLYNYTPHRPDSAYTLANDGNYYYGNYNFVDYFTSWFGPTFGAKVVQAPGDSRLFVVDGDIKRWIPSGDIYQAWGFDNLQTIPVSQGYFDSIPTASELTRVSKAPSGAVYYLDGGHKHWLQTNQMLQAWNISADQILASKAAIDAVTEAEWAGRFVKSTDNSSTWLLDAGTKHKLLTGDDLYHWGYLPTNFTYLSTAALATFANGPDLGTKITYDGRSYMVDQSRQLLLPDSQTVASWGGGTFVSVNPVVGQLLGNVVTASTFIQDPSQPAWYMLTAGTKRYIPQGNIATAWGYGKSGQTLTSVSTSLLSKLPNATDLTNFVQESGSNKAYLIDDGNKYWMSSANSFSAWLPGGTVLQTYDANSLSRFSEFNAETTIRPDDNGNVYSLDHGNKLYILNSTILGAWGSPRLSSIQAHSPSLVRSLPEGAPAKIFVSSGGQTYFLDDGHRFSLSGSLTGTWGAGSPTAISAEALARFDDAGPAKSFVLKDNIFHAMVGGQLYPIGKYADAYGLNQASAIPLTRNPFQVVGKNATYIAQSTSSSDPRIWLVSGGGKYYFDGTPRLASYGFLSQNVAVTYLDQAILDSLPTQPGFPSLCIKKATSGVKFLNFGTSLGFADGTTLTNLCPAVVNVSDSVFDTFSLQGNVSRVVKDDNGKLYFLENGAKRWITNPNTYQAQYQSYPITYLYGTTIALLPDGAPIN